MEFNFEMTPNESALLSCGKDFLNAAARCLGVNEHGVIEIINDGKFITLAAPATINAAFACEMFLKALVILTNKTNSQPSLNRPTNQKLSYRKRWMRRSCCLTA